ncbi:MAG: hypothetical protein LBH16_02910, partial [Treponema sp.]|nr:hypothetical protein [Treponema sp.]
MDMCAQKVKRAVFPSFLLPVILFIGGCGAIDTFFTSSGTYSVNARSNGLNLDELSIISSNDSVIPFFESSVSGDPDITALIVYLKDQRGDIAGWKVKYVLETGNVTNSNSSQDELTEDQDSADTPDAENPADTSNQSAATNPASTANQTGATGTANTSANTANQ